MAVITKEEFIKKLHDYVGDDTSEKALDFIEDMTDAYSAALDSSSGDNEVWQRKYDELNETWRKKYLHRFYGGDIITDSSDEKEEKEITDETITTDDLFDSTEKEKE